MFAMGVFFSYKLSCQIKYPDRPNPGTSKFPQARTLSVAIADLGKYRDAIRLDAVSVDDNRNQDSLVRGLNEK